MLGQEPTPLLERPVGCDAQAAALTLVHRREDEAEGRSPSATSRCYTRSGHLTGKRCVRQRSRSARTPLPLQPMRRPSHRANLVVTREYQAQGLAAARPRPTDSDNFLLREEPDAVLAAHLEVTECRAARAAEREVARWHGDRDVDPCLLYTS